MSDHYAFNRALNQEAALILTADGHTPGADPNGTPIRTGFEMGLRPSTTPDDPRVIVLLVHSALLTAEEVKRAEESPAARERVLVERARSQEAADRELLPAYAESLSRAGWTTEVRWRGRSVEAIAPRSVVEAVPTA